MAVNVLKPGCGCHIQECQNGSRCLHVSILVWLLVGWLFVASLVELAERVFVSQHSHNSIEIAGHSENFG